MLPDRVQLSCAEARVEEIKDGSVGVFELIHPDRSRTHTEPKSAMRLMVSHGWNTTSPNTDTSQGERDCVGEISAKLRAIQASKANNSKP